MSFRYPEEIQHRKSKSRGKEAMTSSICDWMTPIGAWLLDRKEIEQMWAYSGHDDGPRGRCITGGGIPTQVLHFVSAITRVAGPNAATYRPRRLFAQPGE